MSQEKLHIIRADRGSCLTTIGVSLLVMVFILLWIAVSNFIIDRTSVVRQELFRSGWLIVISFLFGIALHEFCQYVFIRLFGGKPRYSGRKYDQSRTYLQRRYLSTIIMRFWSPGKKYALAQYLVIVLSPAIMTFGVLPIAMMFWQNPAFLSIVWIVGFGNSVLIALDCLIALKLIASGNFDYSVVDESEGTYLVKS